MAEIPQMGPLPWLGLLGASLFIVFLTCSSVHPLWTLGYCKGGNEATLLFPWQWV